MPMQASKFVVDAKQLLACSPYTSDNIVDYRIQSDHGGLSLIKQRGHPKIVPLVTEIIRKRSEKLIVFFVQRCF